MACAWDGSLQQHLTETSTASVFISTIPSLSLPSQHFKASLACSPMLRPFQTIGNNNIPCFGEIFIKTKIYFKIEIYFKSEILHRL